MAHSTCSMLRHGPFRWIKFGLELTVEALGQSIVVAVAATSDGGNDVGVAEPLGVADAEVLDSAVAVMDDLTEIAVLTLVNRHLEGVDGEVAAQ